MQAANFDFNGSVSTDWANTLNWTPASLPGVDDVAFISAGRSVVVSSNLVTNPTHIRVGTSNAGATLSVASGGVLTASQLALGRANSAETKSGTLNLTGGTLSLTGFSSVGLYVGFSTVGDISRGVVNFYSGNLISAGTVYVGGAGANLGVGAFNIYGNSGTIDITSGFFWVTQNSGSSLKWDFHGGNDLTTIETANNWRLFNGNTYTIDFANFYGAIGNYSIKLIESQGTGNADAASLFSFVNTDSVSNYSVALANGNRDLVLSFTADVVPEPSTIGMMILSSGLLMVVWRIRNRRKILPADS